MKTFIYKSNVKLTCPCDSEVMLCLTAGLLADGGTVLPSTLTQVLVTEDCDGCPLYTYYLEYDEAALTDPTYTLNSFDVVNFMCAGCWAGYLVYLVLNDADVQAAILSLLAPV